MENNKINDIDELLLKYDFAKDVLETELNILLKEYVFRNNYNPVEHIKSRIKSDESIKKKLEKKGYEFNKENIINNIHDIIGFRIVCSFLSDVKSVVKVLKSSKLFKIIDERDYISNPKDTGYISYHMNVLVPIHLQKGTEYMEAEIQIRTIAMDFWASLDHKLRYKTNNDIPIEIEKEIYNCSQVIKELDIKMEKFRKR